MATPKGTITRPFTLRSRDQVFVYHNAEHIYLQLRRQVPTEENVLEPSFKVAVDLTAVEAFSIAMELLSIVSSRIQDPPPAS